MVLTQAPAKFLLPIEDISGKYQIICMKNGGIYGIEALIKLASSSKVSIEKFVNYAEKNNFISWLDDSMRPIYFRDFKKFKKVFPGLLKLHINISPKSITPKKARQILKELEEYSLSPTDLVIEITESESILLNLKVMKSFIQELQKHGVEVFLDDFLTKYSTLNILRDLQVDGLKIDRSFIKDIDSSSKGKCFLDIIVGIGNRLDLPLIAEGIESDVQLHRCRQLGIQYFQGFLFSRPLPEAKILDLLHEYQKQSS